MLATCQFKIFLSRQLQYKDVSIRVLKFRILFVVLHVCKTWSLTLKKEHKLRVFHDWCWSEFLDMREGKYKDIEENVITKDIIICIRLILLGWHKIREDKMSGACRTYGDMRNTYKFLFSKPDVKETQTQLEDMHVFSVGFI
jgi:hypothetical protein